MTGIALSAIDIVIISGIAVLAIVTATSINLAINRKNDNDGAAKLTAAAIDLMEEQKKELQQFKARQKAIIDILQIQSEEIGELWKEYETVYGMAYLLHNQLTSQGLVPAGKLPPKRRPPQGGISYDLDNL